MTIILCALAGAGIGAGISLVLYVLGFCVELANCACQIVTCDCNGGDAIPAMWSGSSFLSALLFCTACGAAIGLIYGIYKTKVNNDAKLAERNAQNAEEARKLRVQWADALKRKALKVEDTCSRNKTSFAPMVITRYEASDRMDKILTELSKVTELQGKVAVMADELAHEEGEQ